jgi:hypothetical protein
MSPVLMMDDTTGGEVTVGYRRLELWPCRFENLKLLRRIRFQQRTVAESDMRPWELLQQSEALQ